MESIEYNNHPKLYINNKLLTYQLDIPQIPSESLI